MREDATFYEVLGVDPDADPDTIQAAYRERVKEYHPDVSDHPEARERFERINRARTVLTDQEERARYDRLGHEAYLEHQRRGRTDRDDVAARDPGADAGGQHRGASGRSQGRSRRGDSRGDEATTVGRSAREGRTRTEATGRRMPGRFLLREALSGVALVGVASGAFVATAALGNAMPAASERLLLVGLWTVVALLAGGFAAGSAGALADNTLRAQVLPLALLVGAWALRRAGGAELLVTGLLVYGAFAALFRTSALVARHGRSVLRPAVCWFLGTVPAALVLSASRLSVGDDGPVVALRAPDIEVGIGPAAPGTVAVLALAPPVAVALGYAGWRSVRWLA